MSKYSRTRKAICRISYLDHWIVSRDYFRRNPSETWKESWHKYRKWHIKVYNKRNKLTKYRYSELIKKYTIWQIIH